MEASARNVRKAFAHLHTHVRFVNAYRFEFSVSRVRSLL